GGRGDAPGDGEGNCAGRGVAAAENTREDKGPCRLRAAFSTSRPIAKNSWKRRSACRRTPLSSISRFRARRPEGRCPRRRARIRAEISGQSGLVRVNGLDSRLAKDDLDAIIGIGGLAGIFLPKVETRDEVMHWVAMIGTIEQGRGIAPGTTKVV